MNISKLLKLLFRKNIEGLPKCKDCEFVTDYWYGDGKFAKCKYKRIKNNHLLMNNLTGFEKFCASNIEFPYCESERNIFGKCGILGKNFLKKKN